MIIDTHVHIGKILNFNMQQETLLASMNKYGINFSLVSNVEACGIDKILFGSDNPIDGLDTYISYIPYFDIMKKSISKEDYDKLMFKNAIKLFSIKNQKIFKLNLEVKK